MIPFPFTALFIHPLIETQKVISTRRCKKKINLFSLHSHTCKKPLLAFLVEIMNRDDERVEENFRENFLEKKWKFISLKHARKQNEQRKSLLIYLPDSWLLFFSLSLSLSLSLFSSPDEYKRTRLCKLFFWYRFFGILNFLFADANVVVLIGEKKRKSSLNRSPEITRKKPISEMTSVARCNQKQNKNMKTLVKIVELDAKKLYLT